MEYVITIDNWNIPSAKKMLDARWKNGERIKSGAMQMISAYSKHVPKAQNFRDIQIEHIQPVGRFPTQTTILKICSEALKNLRLILADDTASKLYAHMKYGKKQTIIKITDAE